MNAENKFNEMKSSKDEQIKLLMVKYTTEKASYEAKLQEHKKYEKEMETTLKKQLNQLRTDNALFFEKLSNTEARLKESETNRNEETVSLRQQLTRVKQFANNKQKELSEALKQTRSKLETISN